MSLCRTSSMCNKCFLFCNFVNAFGREIEEWPNPIKYEVATTLNNKK